MTSLNSKNVGHGLGDNADDVTVTIATSAEGDLGQPGLAIHANPPTRKGQPFSCLLVFPTWVASPSPALYVSNTAYQLGLSTPASVRGVLTAALHDAHQVEPSRPPCRGSGYLYQNQIQIPGAVVFVSGRRSSAAASSSTRIQHLPSAQLRVGSLSDLVGPYSVESFLDHSEARACNGPRLCAACLWCHIPPPPSLRFGAMYLLGVIFRSKSDVYQRARYRQGIREDGWR
ncbi:hypothetical protein FPV67DRAFT_1449820 [Lyophyllum atratum]|nr:hypothetical protein FPV67DRAFT_1449820 [Lyophyllum atratum]